MKCKELEKVPAGLESLNPDSRTRNIAVGGAGIKDGKPFTVFKVGPLPNMEASGAFADLSALFRDLVAPHKNAVIEFFRGMNTKFADTMVKDIPSDEIFKIFDDAVVASTNKLDLIYGPIQSENLRKTMAAATGIKIEYWENSTIRQIIAAIVQVVAINSPLSGLPKSLTDDIDNGLGLMGLSLPQIKETARKVGEGMLSNIGNQGSPFGALPSFSSESPTSVESILAALQKEGVDLRGITADPGAPDQDDGNPAEKPTSTSSDSPS